MQIYELEIGGLYNTKHIRRDTLELYSKSHARGDEASLESTLGSILHQDDYFVVLEVELLYKTYYCLKLLTSRGIIGWTCKLQYNHEWDRVQFEKLTS